jgi:Tetratricopeptide repeat/Peptidase_C39 like family
VPVDVSTSLWRWTCLLSMVLVLAGLTTACARHSLVGEGAPWPAPRRAELTSVPFFSSDTDQCGPAALATLLTYEGVARRPEDLASEVYLPARHGSLQVELLAATRSAGLVPYLIDPSLSALLGELAAGNPVLVLQRLGLTLRPDWHYAVAVGYDLDKDEIVLRSGTARRLVLSIGMLDRAWSDGGRWAFVALPPDRLPRTAVEGRYVASAAALESVSMGAAATAYRTVLTRWPHNLVAQIGLGNIAYRRGRYREAVARFRVATRDHPNNADAWNNLAEALSRAGRRAKALIAARRAVAIGGAHKRVYYATLREVEGKAPGLHR